MEVINANQNRNSDSHIIIEQPSYNQQPAYNQQPVYNQQPAYNQQINNPAGFNQPYLGGGGYQQKQQGPTY